MIADDATDV